MKEATVWLLLCFAAAVVTTEVTAWGGRFQRSLVRRAAAGQPEQHRARYEEEWLAELDAVPDGLLTRTLWALDLYLRHRRLSRALGAPPSRAMRAVDVIVGGASLVIYSPLIILTAVVIRSTTGGPVFHVCRHGEDQDAGKLPLISFVCYTYPPAPGARPSLTPVGRVLRATSCHMLPRFVNIVHGEISLRDLLR